MGSFFIEFRDPLFSIIILFGIIFMISFFSYWWGRYKTKDNHQYLDKFLAQFHVLPSEVEIKKMIHQGELSEKSWLLLADTYTKNGDYEKAVEIYKELLLYNKNSENTKEIMFLLGKTYFKAGFLGRSRDVFLEILRKNPRTPQALHYLLLVYEYMKDYKAAQEVLEPLDQLNEDISKEALYLQILSLIDSKKDVTQKILELYQKHQMLERIIFEYLFKNYHTLAWKHLPLEKTFKIADLLWQLPKEKVDFNIVANSTFLKELYSAKGYIQEVTSSSVFELDILIKLEGKANATIGFEYICNECKVTYPFNFHRCSSCHAIDSAELEYSLIRDYSKEQHETSHSFL
ncbi:MAG: hypothetical protein GXO11_01395 [Epsilonproteobacteria bacterium]|nr:hypothetical protein [Campylobacterota bacterium]